MSTPYLALRNRLRWLGYRLGASRFVTQLLPGTAARASSYAQLMRLDSPIGIWLLLWPVLWALWLSSAGRPDPHVFVVFLLGTVLIHSGGSVINDIADRDFDEQAGHKQDRPLVTGRIERMEALVLCAGLGLIALGLLMTLNPLTQLLGLAAGVLAIGHPFIKYFFALPQLYLGVALSWGVPMVFAAQTNTLPRLAWLLFLAGLAWSMVYCTMYAMAKQDEDREFGIRSSAILFGDADRFIIGIMQLMALFALWLAGRELHMGLWYGLGLAAAAVFATYQQLLIRERQASACWRAFLNNNYFGMSVFIGIALEYLFH